MQIGIIFSFVYRTKIVESISSCCAQKLKNYRCRSIASIDVNFSIKSTKFSIMGNCHDYSCQTMIRHPSKIPTFSKTRTIAYFGRWRLITNIPIMKMDQNKILVINNKLQQIVFYIQIGRYLHLGQHLSQHGMYGGHPSLY